MDKENLPVKKSNLLSKQIHCFIQLVAFGLRFDEAYERVYGEDDLSMEKGLMIAEEHSGLIEERKEQIAKEEENIHAGLRFARRVSMFEALDLANDAGTRLKAVNAYLKVYELNHKIYKQKEKTIDLVVRKSPEDMTPSEREAEILKMLNNEEGK